MNIPEWALALIATGFLGIIGWGVRRLMEGQETVGKELGSMTNHLTKVCGHIDVINERAQQDRGICDERQQNNIEEHQRFLDELKELRR